MLSIQGYRDFSPIYVGKRSVVYRAVREVDDLRVVLKTSVSDRPTPEEVVERRREYALLSALKLDSVIRAYAFEEIQGRPVLVLEDFRGSPFRGFIAGQTRGLQPLLKMAIGLTQALGQVHAAGIVHKDINPDNVLVNEKSGEIRLIDFELAGPSLREDPSETTVKLQGTLRYISPEQTGRTNRVLDYRTDLYSLGVSLYEALCGKPPFESSDPLELIHCHIAIMPVPPAEVDADIPKPISDIVMKLLSKDAEDRYQSAEGVAADLEECLRRLEVGERIEGFVPAKRDVPRRFDPTQKLFGRAEEMRTLMDTFEVVARGLKKTVLVFGPAGVGKTRLVRELYAPVVQMGGWFVYGKFDRTHQDRPYSAVEEALRGLVKRVLTLPDEQLEQWRERLASALGPNAALMVKMIPELELVLGPQGDFSEGPPSDMQNRFRFTLQAFVGVFCQPKAPCLIVMDDLQWADSSSLRLIEMLIRDDQLRFLMIVGTCRDGDSADGRITQEGWLRLMQAGFTDFQLALSPLGPLDVNQLIATALQAEPNLVRELAESVYGITGGNPFRINELLLSLFAQGALRKDVDLGRWSWETDAIEAIGQFETADEWLQQRMLHLSPAVRESLVLGAAFGHHFEIAALANVLGAEPSDFYVTIEQALTAGILRSSGGTPLALGGRVLDRETMAGVTFKFMHDYMHNAAYAMIPEDDRPALHRRLGLALLQTTPEEELENKIFEIVDHLNEGVEAIIDQSERARAADLNLIAARKAMASVAFEAAARYCDAGIRLLSPDAWQSAYDTALALYTEGVRAACFMGDHEKAESLSAIPLERARSLLDRVPVYETLVHGLVVRNRLAAVVNLALEVVRQLGFRLPKRPTKLHVLAGLLMTYLAIVVKGVNRLPLLPQTVDEKVVAAGRLLSTSGTAAYMAMPEMLPLMVFKVIRLSLKRGNTSVSAHAYASFGMLLCGVAGAIEEGYRIGRLFQDTIDRMQNARHAGRAIFLFNYCVRHWKEHLGETLSPLLDAGKVCLQTGDFEFAARSESGHFTHAWFLGYPLIELLDQMDDFIPRLRWLGQEALIHQINIYRQTIWNLMRSSHDPCHLKGEYLDEDRLLPELQEARDMSKLAYLGLCKLVLAYLFGDRDRAVESAALVERSLGGVRGTYAVALFYFYDSLVRLRWLDDDTDVARRQSLKKVASNQKKLKKWASHASANFEHKYLLVQAELLRIQGKDIEASELYDHSIRHCRLSGYCQEEALACEIAARFYDKNGRFNLANAYAYDARGCYSKWGAVMKVTDMERLYPQLVRGQASPASAVHRIGGDTIAGAISSLAEGLDLVAVMRAAQAISSEIHTEGLTEALMRLAAEIAGAEKGVLVLHDGDGLRVAAQLTMAGVEPPREWPGRHGTAQGFPAGLVNYVMRTGETVVLDDAAHDPTFGLDSYIVAEKTRSTVCVPIVRQNRVKGGLYLENNLAPGSFTRAHMEALKILCSQAAISLENAALYEEVQVHSRLLEQKVAQRTSELEQTNEQLSHALKEREVLLREVHHRVKNNLAAVMSFLQMQSRRVGDQKVRDLFEAAQARVSSLNILHQMLYMSESLTNVRATDYLGSLIDHLYQLYASVGTRVRLVRDIGEIFLDMDSAIPVGFIVTELTTNSMKHAFPHGRGGEIRISLSRVDERYLELVVADDGVGLPEDAIREKNKSLGLSLVDIFVRQLHGELSVTGETGAEFRIRFPSPQQL